jgi:hypothetical protein
MLKIIARFWAVKVGKGFGSLIIFYQKAFRIKRK